MSGNNQRKSYFIQDTELKNSDQDFFRHEDVANNLKRVIKENEAPFNVAVIGKWGLGKSSLINLGLHELEADSKHYKRIDINAWKYEKETLSKVFLQEVLQGLEDPENRQTSQEIANENFLDRLKEIFCHKPQEESVFKALCRSIWNNRLFCIIWAVVAFIVYFLYKGISLWIDGKWLGLSSGVMWAMAFTGYLRNSVTLLVIPFFILVVTKLLQEVKSKSAERIGYLPQGLNVEDYEILLNRKIREKHLEDLTILIVVDDLDRLSAPKMVEALDAIKMFMGFRKCIFIVPFDDTILKTAIQHDRLNDESGNKLADSDELLDKLFQYKLYLAPVLSYDIKDYAVKLCQDSLHDFFTEYTDDNGTAFLSAVRRILIYRDVKTPRQVKKLINTYVNYVMLAHDRETAGKVNHGFTVAGMDIIAKISVLQADFNDVYDALFDDDKAIDKILNYYDSVLNGTEADSTPEGNDEQNESVVTGNKVELPTSLKIAAKIVDSDTPFKNAMPLINFLKHTRGIDSDDLSSYLYVAEDEITRATGTKNRRDFLDAASSSNVEESKKLLKDNPSLAEAGNVFIQSSNDSKDSMAVISVLSQCFELISDADKKDLADTIALASGSLSKECDNDDLRITDFNGLLEFYRLTSHKDEFDDLLRFVLSREVKTRATDITEAFYSHYKDLTEQTKVKLSEYTAKVCEDQDVPILDFIGIRDDYIDLDDSYTQYWLDSFYDYLVDSVSKSEEDGQKIIIEELTIVFKALPKEDYDVNIRRLKSIFGVSAMEDTLLDLLNNEERVTGHKAEQGTIDDVIVAQIQGTEYSDGVNEFLETFKYDLTDDNETIIDGYLKDQDAGSVIRMLRNVIRVGDDDFKRLPKTIEELITEPINKRTQQIANVCELIKLNDNYAWKQIYALVKPLTAAGHTNFVGLVDILAERYAIGSAPIYEVLTANIAYIKGYASSGNFSVEFLAFNTDLISRTIGVSYRVGRVTDAENKLVSEYLTALLGCFDAGYLMDSVIHNYAALNYLLNETTVQNIESKFYNALNDENAEDIFDIFDEHYDVVGKMKSGDGNYCDVALKAFPNSSKQNQILVSLNNKFSWISQTEKLACMVYESDEAKESVYVPLLSKYLRGEMEKEGGIGTLCTIAYKTDADFLNKVFGGKAGELELALSEVVRNKDKYTYNHVIGLIRWMNTLLPVKGTYQYCSDIYLVAISEADTEDKKKQVAGLLIEVPKKVLAFDKDKWIDAYVGLFATTTSDGLKKEIVKSALEKGVKRHFIESLQEPDQDKAKDIIKDMNKAKRQNAESE